ncbi:MAG: ATP-binding protein [Ignavibacteria bacterium]|nr:ATP-binding protein [Ignavibacteria bacterium]
MEDNFELEINFTSDKFSLSIIETILQKVQNKFPFEKKKFQDILVATTEAVINAIQHGNQCDPMKNVTLKVVAYDKNLIVIVSDEGRGFDPTNLDDPRKPENIHKERGRGIFLIKELSDNFTVQTSEKGTEVKILFNI